jgi:hypothetical protein
MLDCCFGLNKFQTINIIVMKPIPPISIKTKMTIWPNQLKVSPVNAGDSPVSDAAEQAIKKAFQKLYVFQLFVS